MISLIRDQKIGSRLFGSFFVMISLMGTIAIVALVQTGSVNYLVAHGRTTSTRLKHAVDYLGRGVEAQVPQRELIMMRIDEVKRVSRDLISYAPIFPDKRQEVFENGRELLLISGRMDEALKGEEPQISPEKLRTLQGLTKRLQAISDDTVATVRKEINRSVRSGTQIALVLLGLGSALGLFLALTQGWNITSRILEITRVSRQVARGNFEVFVPITPRLEDEVSELNETFNLMTYELATMQQEIERYSEHLNEMVSEKTRALRNTNDQLKTTMERLEEANEHLVQTAQMRTDFLARMSHELVTPLNAVIGFCEILMDGSAGQMKDQQLEFLQDIFQSASNLRQMIRDLIDIAQIEAGKATLNREPVNVYFWLFNTQQNVRARAEEKNITLELDVPDQTLEVQADQSRLNQVITNLLNNAIKYTPEGGTVTTRAWQENGRLYVSVTDTGIGIPKKYHDAIFDAFQHIHTQIARKHFGPGLGLALVKNFVEMHGGQISLESEVGEGSTFTFWLPVSVGETEEAQTPVKEVERAPRAEERRREGVKTVLVSTRNSHLADIIDTYLNEVGYEIEKTAPGEPTVAAALGMMPFAILIDMEPTGQIAWETLEQIKEHPEARGVPVFLLLESVEKTITARMRKLGINEMLTKPVDRFELICALANIRETEAAEAAARAKIVVADGDDLSRRLITGGLRRAGFEVNECSECQSCTQVVTESPPDAIVMDIDLPATGAFDAIIGIRRQPRTAALPIIITSQREMTEEERGFLSGKTYRTLRKGPGMIEELVTLLRTLFEK